MVNKSVCVYCGSSTRVGEVYQDAARVVGAALAQNHNTLVYGGSHVGLMGLVADAVLAAQGKAVGIITEHLKDRESHHDSLTEIHVTDTLHARKQMMADRADAFVILPGGLGTLDETMEILTWKQLGLHNKPIIFYNVEGYWDTLFTFLEHVIGKGFAPHDNRQLYKTATTPAALVGLLNAPADPYFDPSTKWM